VSRVAIAVHRGSALLAGCDCRISLAEAIIRTP
jgi:hypothetical protein